MEEETVKMVKVKAVEISVENFKEYGQVIERSVDGEHFGPLDAQLDLSRGIPRFYIMSLKEQKLQFSTITHHANVTQCLGSIGGHTWYLGVAKPSIVNRVNLDDLSKKIVKSPSGHLYVPPNVDEVQVFRITGPKFIKLNVGTWHAGPLFLSAEAMDFYNLELSDTNEVDHTTHSFLKDNGVRFVVDE